ncbi:hypothetical protein VitviT2T_020012 [Vitis vinifera]|uniref:Retrovirus-related Pol polyprotein from transposon RE1 n=1 Tax=Vitis vinifera TaxID=29760 RepID=A0ABY9D314_VITVI|nr:hypothetical protein VitviT2T_020012 [Vitis vinifera]
MKIKKEGITISEYLARIKEVFDKYSAMGEPLSYRDKLMYTLNGLTEEYDGFVTSIYNRSDKSSLKEVHSLLYTYAYWLEQRNTAQQLQFSQFPNSQPKPQPPNPIAAMLTTSTSPTMPFNNCDTPWYMDSGATHHFTPEFGNLTDPCVLTGDEQAMDQALGKFLLLNYPSIVLKPSSLSIIISYCGIID